jgi:signal transduction histidine kinase
MQKENLDLILAILSASVFVLLVVVAGFALFRIYLKRKNTLLQEKEQMNVQFRQTLLHSKLAIQEETFNYIGKEIHDNIGQVLSLVRISLNTITANPDEQKIFLMDELMGKAITDLRNLSHSLDTDLIRNTGWIKASERILLAIQKTSKCKVEFSAEENLPTLGDEKPIILFRMIQEILNNIIKHAGAKEIKFQATRSDNQILINIEDNGKGFDRTTVSAGAGLQNLESRAKVIDANLFIHTLPGSGTRVTISVNT